MDQEVRADRADRGVPLLQDVDVRPTINQPVIPNHVVHGKQGKAAVAGSLTISSPSKKEL